MGERFVVEGEIPGVFSRPRVLELRVYDDGTLSGAILTEEQNEQAVDAKLMHGTAVRRSDKHDAGDDDSQEPVYQVEFQLARPRFESDEGKDLRGPVTLFSVVGTLSSSSGLHAQWSDLFDAHEFILSTRQSTSSERRAVADLSSNHTLHPLVPGAYILKGAAIGANGYMYPATCVLKLRAGGS